MTNIIRGITLIFSSLVSLNLFADEIKSEVTITETGKYVVCLHTSTGFHEANKGETWNLPMTLHSASGKKTKITFKPPFLAVSPHGPLIHYCVASEFGERGTYDYSYQRIRGVVGVGFNHVSFRK